MSGSRLSLAPWSNTSTSTKLRPPARRCSSSPVRRCGGIERHTALISLRRGGRVLRQAPRVDLRIRHRRNETSLCLPVRPGTRAVSDSIRVGVTGAAGRMGATTCEAVEAADDLELTARIDPELGVELQTPRATSTSSWTSPRPTPRRGTSGVRSRGRSHRGWYLGLRRTMPREGRPRPGERPRSWSFRTSPSAPFS